MKHVENNNGVSSSTILKAEVLLSIKIWWLKHVVH